MTFPNTRAPEYGRINGYSLPLIRVEDYRRLIDESTAAASDWFAVVAIDDAPDMGAGRDRLEPDS